MPHLSRALDLHLRFLQLRMNSECLGAGLDAFGHASFGLDQHGRIVVMNRLAEEMLKCGGLKIIDGRLSATSTQTNKQLQSAIAHVIASGTHNGTSAGESFLLSRHERDPLVVTAIPFLSHALDSNDQLRALVFLVDPSAQPKSRATVLRGLFRLTPTECKLSDLLAAGKDIKEIATSIGITLETARFHLKRILAKTGLHRQAELVRLILSLPGS
jgi:DNA-binding CsgD family transcriptional regulator